MLTIVDICVPKGALLTADGYGRIHFAQKFHQIPLSSFLKEISSIREKLKTGKNVLSSEMVRFLPFELPTAMFIMAFLVVEFSRQGYKISNVFG